MSLELEGTPVMICSSCGKGFIVAPRGMLDPDPVWHIASTNERGKFCGGTVKMISKEAACLRLKKDK